jgi:phospholipid/cholesterol/gamma-HCH transport system substrate-binding protein
MSKEFKVALLAIVSGTILYLGFTFLKGSDLMSSTNTYYVTYPEIDGLTVSNPVMINGLMVGRVSEIKLDQEHNNQLLVTMEIDKSVMLGDSTVAFLGNNSLLGSKAIKLELGKNSKVYEGDEYLVGKKELGLGELIAEKATPVVNHIDQAISRLNKIMEAIPEKNVTQIVKNLDAASAGLKTIMHDNASNINQMTGSLAQLSASLVKTEAELKPLIAKFSSLADSLNDLQLKETVNNANATLANLNTITAKINQGDGTMGALVNDKSFYINLNKTLSDIDSLVLDLQENPNHYLAPLGKKSKKKK